MIWKTSVLLKNIVKDSSGQLINYLVKAIKESSIDRVKNFASDTAQSVENAGKNVIEKVETSTSKIGDSLKSSFNKVFKKGE